MPVKVYIAEDDQFLVKAYQMKLAQAGFEVFVAYDGQQLLDKLKEGDPDIILLDLIMPTMDGFVTLTQLHADGVTQRVPVIVASNLGQEEDIRRAKELGARDFILKSNVSLQAIVDIVHKYSQSSAEVPAE